MKKEIKKYLVFCLCFCSLTFGCTQNPLINNTINTDATVRRAIDTTVLTGEHVLKMWENGTSLFSLINEIALPPGLMFKDSTWGIGLDLNGRKDMYYQGKLIERFPYLNFHGPGVYEPRVYGGYLGNFYFIGVVEDNGYMYIGPKLKYYVINTAAEEISLLPKVDNPAENGLYEVSNAPLEEVRKVSNTQVIFWGAFHYQYSNETYSFFEVERGTYHNFTRFGSYQNNEWSWNWTYP